VKPGDAARRVLWGVGTPRTLRAHWALLELGLLYETRPLIPRTPRMRDPEFLRLTRRGKVPFLEDGDVAIGESAAIAFHLADRYRDRGHLAPEPATAERAVFDDLCLFILTELDAALYIIRRHEGLPAVYGEAPAACSAARAYFLRGLGEVERRLADGRPHLLGDAFSAADLLLITCLAWARLVAIELPESLAGYCERIHQRAAFGRAVRVNFPPEAVAALRGEPIS